MFSGRMSRETDVYYRLEAFTQTGLGGYDLMASQGSRSLTT